MKSKKLVSSLIALSIIATSSLGFGLTAKAATVVPSTNKVSVQATSGYQYKSLNVVMTKQEQKNWCWAASTQAVLKYLGVSASQTNIVTYIKGSPVNTGGTTYEMMNAIKHFAPQSKTKGITTSGKLSFQQVKAEIDAGRPIIASIWIEQLHHAVVIYGYTVQASGAGSVMYKSPNTTSYQAITDSYDDFCNTFKWDGSVYGI